MRSVIARMNDQSAAMLIGFYLENRSATELSADFGITPEAVRSRLFRARTKFRELFEVTHEEFVEAGL